MDTSEDDEDGGRAQSLAVAVAALSMECFAGDAIFACPACDRRLTTSSGIKNHVKLQHGRSLDITWRCSRCDETRPTYQGIKNHEKDKHAVEEAVEPAGGAAHNFFFFALLPFDFSTESRLILRVKTPGIDCDQAWRMADDSGGVNSIGASTTTTASAGMLVSHRAAMFACPSCSQTFTTAKGLKLHFRTAHKQELHLRYTCSACEETFGAEMEAHNHESSTHGRPAAVTPAPIDGALVDYVIVDRQKINNFIYSSSAPSAPPRSSRRCTALRSMCIASTSGCCVRSTSARTAASAPHRKTSSAATAARRRLARASSARIVFVAATQQQLDASDHCHDAKDHDIRRDIKKAIIETGCIELADVRNTLHSLATTLWPQRLETSSEHT